MSTRDSAVTTLAGDLGFTEGPLLTREGDLIVASLTRQCLFLVAGGQGSLVTHVEGSPSGLAQDALGRIWIVHSSHPRAITRNPDHVGVSCLVDGSTHRVASEGLTAPNDCVISPDGRYLIFTDPKGHAFDAHPQFGAVRALNLNTYHVQTLLDDCLFPNGLAFSPSSEVMYVAETAARRILRYRYTGNELTSKEVFFDLPHGHPDGMFVRQDGYLLVATTTGNSIAVIDPDGRLVEEIYVGEASFPTNVTMGRPGSETVYVTAAKGGRVLAIKPRTP